jgi:hypothetical protein
LLNFFTGTPRIFVAGQLNDVVNPKFAGDFVNRLAGFVWV